ncbi:MAG: hypothetical protein EXS15_01675 [Phycisphaerales bacterium]|nr:hypothetical protein [Phycisphaerales bacterium]
MVNDSNLWNWDYRDLAARLGSPCIPIVDAHAHVGGLRAAEILIEAMDLYGVAEIWSMTSVIEQLDPLRELFGNRIRFIAVPNWRDPNRRESHGVGYARRIRDFHARGASIAKFWAAPRGIDIGHEVGDPALMRLDNPVRIEAMQTAFDLGMTFMVHVADPNTWFATRYADASRYGTKASQYEPLEIVLDRFPARWIAAHMGGWPEDLEFLSGLLTRHANLVLDTSATKWMIREVSRHEPSVVGDFFARWSGRLMFGSDIVTSDEHLSDASTVHEMDAKAHSRASAFDLYASRYWALRTLWETNWTGASPIADPDLAMVDPAAFAPKDSPALRGIALPQSILRDFYANTACAIAEEMTANVAQTRAHS